ncbi:hypothetical protein AAG906_002350 [Vitis piasezkii]
MATISNSLFSPLTSPSPLSPRRPSTFTVSLSAPRFLSLQSNPRSTFIACASLDAGKGDVPVEKTHSAFPTVMDINQIREILPDRFPFLLVDRVIEYNPGISAVAIKNVTITITSFLVIADESGWWVQAMAQVRGLVMLQPEVGGSRENFFFAGIDKVRFQKPVIAGDTLVMRMTLVKHQKRFGIAKMEGKAYVGGEVRWYVRASS